MCKGIFTQDFLLIDTTTYLVDLLTDLSITVIHKQLNAYYREPLGTPAVRSTPGGIVCPLRVAEEQAALVL